MFKAILQSFSDVFIKENRKTFYKTILLTVLSYLVLIWLLTFTFAKLKLSGIAWLDNSLNVVGGILAFILALFLLPSLISALSELFSDKIITNTEKKLFTKLPKVNAVSRWNNTLYTLHFSFKSAFFIVGLSIAYIITLPLLFVPMLGAITAFIVSLAFYLTNAFILGKGYFDTVAMRYLTDELREDTWYLNRLKLVLTGFLITFLFSIPFVNLLAPIYSFALMTRIFWHIKSNVT